MGSFFGPRQSGTSTSRSRGTTNQLNFAPFQQAAINRVFNALQEIPDNVLQGSAGQTTLLGGGSPLFSDAASATRRLLQGDPVGEAQSLIQFALGEAQRTPFDFIINRNLAEADRDAFALGRNLLLPTAQGQFLPGQALSNQFFEPGVVDPAVTDARNAVLSGFARSGRNLAGNVNAQQMVAREAGRTSAGLRAQQFERERQLQQGAQLGIGQGDLNDALRRLQAIAGAESGQRGNETVRQNASNLRLAAINAMTGGQALGFQSLQPLLNIEQAQQAAPFVPLSLFSDIAFRPLGQESSFQSQVSQPIFSQSPFSTLLGAGLVGASAFGAGGPLAGAFGGGSVQSGFDLPSRITGFPLATPGGGGAGFGFNFGNTFGTMGANPITRIPVAFGVQ